MEGPALLGSGCLVFDDDQRVVDEIRLPLRGSVVAAYGVVPWLFVDEFGEPVAPVMVFLRDFAAGEHRLPRRGHS